MNSLIPYADELTVFMMVKIDNLKEFSKLIWLRLNSIISKKVLIIKIITDMKYFLISSISKLIFVNINLFIKTFFGLLNDNIWLKEYFNNE